MSIRSIRAALALVASATLVSCEGSISAPSQPSSGVVLHIATANQQAPTAAFVHVVVTYTSGSAQVPLFDQQVPLSSTNSQTVSVSVDIAPCLSDPAHVGGSACSISVTVTLLDAAKAQLDSRTVGPLLVSPEQPPATVAATLNSRYSVTLQKIGLGSGNVTFSPVASSATGGFFAANSSVTLSATASATSVFVGWLGDCSGAAACTLRMDANKSVQALFDTTYAVTVATSGSGSGTVSASPAGPRYQPGTSVTLTATPSSGSVFSGWSGACSGSATTCVVSMTTNQSVTAIFVPVQTFTITVTKSGAGSGTVTQSPSAPSYPSGTTVVLTAAASSGSVFAGWSGACTGTSSTCSVSMTADRSVGAAFNLSNTTYDGDYTGSFSGAASGSVVFTVRNGVISATQPGVGGTGSVNPNGSGTFSTSLASGGCTKTFTGSFFVVGNGRSAGGNWVCGTESGTWSATGTAVP